MSAIFFRQFGMSQPDINFGVGSGTQAEQTAAVMTACERLCVSKPAAWTIVVPRTSMPRWLAPSVWRPSSAKNSRTLRPPGHHRELHKLNIDPLPVALQLWQQTRTTGEISTETTTRGGTGGDNSDRLGCGPNGDERYSTPLSLRAPPPKISTVPPTGNVVRCSLLGALLLECPSFKRAQLPK